MSSDTTHEGDEENFYDEQDTGPEWATPAWIYEPLATAVGGFDLDPASGAEAEPIAAEQYTVEDDGLESEWFGHVWLNPPYGRSHNPTWAQRVTEATTNDRVDSITALVPASTSTQWWQNHYAAADYCTWIDTRVSFDGDGDHSATFASVICTFDCGGGRPGIDDIDSYLAACEQLGTVTGRIDR